MPVLLLTDLAFLGAIGIIGGYFWTVRRNLLARRRWRTVIQAPAGGGAALMLLAFAGIATLDSLHFEARGATLSVLDRLLTPLRVQVETTYSAPFATSAYVRETVTDTQGRIMQQYPRLRYGGRHLADPARERATDLWRRAAVGVAVGLASFVAIACSIQWWRRRTLRGWMTAMFAPPWRVHWVLIGILCLGGGLLCSLAPSYHVLGTDKVGNDVLYLTLKSVRTGLVLGLVSSLIAVPIAVVLGIAAGYFGGWVDDVVQYLYTTLSSVPGVLLIAATALSFDLLLQQYAGTFTSLALRADTKLLALCLVLGLTGWPNLCRLLRAEVMKLRAIDYILAGRALGSTPLTILRRHLLPNAFHLVIITTALDFSGLVLAEAVLTYIDIGVDPSMESWGNLINGARLELAREPMVWWSLVAAFSGMFTLVLAANLFADAVRDAFDPRIGDTEVVLRKETVHGAA